MYRCSVPLLILAAALLGCSKKTNSPTGGGAEPGGEPGEPSATYTLTFRQEQKGDKLHVVKTRDGESTTTVGGGKSVSKKEGYRYEYTETVIERPVGAPKPTRSDRVYKTAKKTDDRGEMKPLTFEGKTVEVQVSPFEGVGYIFIVAGNAVQPPDRDDLIQEFQGGEKPSKDGPKKAISEAFLPGKPVKVGEEWAGDITKTPLAGGPFDKDQSKMTIKLVKVYQKDGQQWGTLEAKIVQVAVPVGKGPPFSGTVTTDLTIDAVIDGSSPARVIKMKGSGTLSTGDKGVKLGISITQEETVTPVK